MRRAFHTGLRHHDIACGAKPCDLQRVRRRRGGHVQCHLLSPAITDLARVALDVKRLRLRLIAEADGRHETEALEDEESAHEGGISNDDLLWRAQIAKPGAPNRRHPKCADLREGRDEESSNNTLWIRRNSRASFLLESSCSQIRRMRQPR